MLTCTHKEAFLKTTSKSIVRAVEKLENQLWLWSYKDNKRVRTYLKVSHGFRFFWLNQTTEVCASTRTVGRLRERLFIGKNHYQHRFPHIKTSERFCVVMFLLAQRSKLELTITFDCRNSEAVFTFHRPKP